MKYQKKSQNKNPIWYSNKKNKVPRNKPNQGGKRTVLRKLYTTEEKKLRKTQTNGSMYNAHGLEELTYSKWPYYPKHFIDSMQSLLKFQWNNSQIKNKHFRNLYGTINDPE